MIHEQKSMYNSSATIEEIMKFFEEYKLLMFMKILLMLNKLQTIVLTPPSLMPNHSRSRIRKTHFECETQQSAHLWFRHNLKINFFSCQMQFFPYTRFTMLKELDFIHLTWHIYLPMKLTDGHSKKCSICEASIFDELKCLNFIKSNAAFIIILKYIWTQIG